MNIDAKTLLSDFKVTYERVMHEIADGRREALGVTAVWQGLMNKRDEIKQLAEQLDGYPEAEGPTTVPIGTALETLGYHGGSITTTAASATNLPTEPSD